MDVDSFVQKLLDIDLLQATSVKLQPDKKSVENEKKKFPVGVKQLLKENNKIRFKKQKNIQDKIEKIL